MRITQVIKKDHTLEEYDAQKIANAIEKSANRVMHKLTSKEIEQVVNLVDDKVQDYLIDTGFDKIEVASIHTFVEQALDEIVPSVAKSYREYRNYKQDFVHILDKVYQKAQSIEYVGDKSNANTDSTLVTTQRSLIADELNKELYNRFHLSTEEKQACRDGFIYIHDKNARRFTFNCSVIDAGAILKDGFEMGNIWYNEPKTIDTACDVLSDVIFMAGSCQYGGLTVNIDTTLAPYVEKSYRMYKREFYSLAKDLDAINPSNEEYMEDRADKYAEKKTYRDLLQGIQGLEYKLNSVASSRGDYIFVSFAFGLEQGFGEWVSRAVLETRMKGQGKKGRKRPVLFPKLIFAYDKELHGEGKPLNYLFELGIQCSSKAMYPDFCSYTGKYGMCSKVYKEYGKPIYSMGCVDGNSIIDYKIKGVRYVESFKRAWDRLSDLYEIKTQPNGKDLYIDTEDVEIFDNKLMKYVKQYRIVRNTQSDWLEIKLNNGRYLRTTTDHPFEVKGKGVVYGEDLQIKDKMLNLAPVKANLERGVSIQRIPNFNGYQWLTGMILCDGCLSQGNINVSLGIDEVDLMSKTAEEMEKLGMKVSIKEHHRGEKGDYYEVVGLASSEFKHYFTSLFGGEQKIYRQIPNGIFNASREDKLSFLAGMIDADGYINSKYSRVQLGSTNEELALQQMALAQDLGFYASIHLNHYTSKDPSKIRYRVEFQASEELLHYLVSEKKISHYRKINRRDIPSRLYCEVKSIAPYTKEQYSYDVTTESEHFMVNGIYSHNCRSYASPYFDENSENPNEPIVIGRANFGVVSLHLPLIYQKAKVEGKDFYEVLDHYLEMARQIHKNTKEFLSKKKASTNPLMYMWGGLYNGHLKANDTIEPVLKHMTASFGITALNELEQLHHQKSLVEDGSFALEVMKHIEEKVEQFKKEDNILYGIYGTPAESLAQLQVQQFRKMYGVIPNVSDKEWVTNSFHCNVTEDIDGITKQDKELRFWELFDGGHIQYVRYPIQYNTEAIKTYVNRAMDLGFYEGINLELGYCEDCGHEELSIGDTCPCCGSHNTVEINRMNGYLGYTRIKGESRMSDGKTLEVKSRKSM